MVVLDTYAQNGYDVKFQIEGPVMSDDSDKLSLGRMVWTGRRLSPIRLPNGEIFKTERGQYLSAWWEQSFAKARPSKRRRKMAGSSEGRVSTYRRA
jgi:hypothetical protein